MREDWFIVGGTNEIGPPESSLHLRNFIESKPITRNRSLTQRVKDKVKSKFSRKEKVPESPRLLDCTDALQKDLLCDPAEGQLVVAIERVASYDIVEAARPGTEEIISNDTGLLNMCEKEPDDAQLEQQLLEDAGAASEGSCQELEKPKKQSRRSRLKATFSRKKKPKEQQPEL